MLLEIPVMAGHHLLKNRMVKAPIHSETCVDGYVTPKTEKDYEDRSRGGRFGLYVVEHSYVRKDGMASPTQLSSSRDSDIEGLKRLADILHRNGSTAILQINHAGCGASQSFTGEVPVSPSGISVTCGWPNAKPQPDVPKVLSVSEIHELEDAYIKAAERAMKAGYDGINLHSAHAYLLCQFYSPITNKRTDEYNGFSIEGRTKIHLELIKGIRQVIGPKALFALRLGGCDYTEGGSTIEDAVEACKLFEKAGVDLLDISGGTCCFTRKGHDYPGYFGDISEAVKKAVQVPVMLTGGVKNVKDAEALLRANKADLIGVGRPITANADWGMELAG
ncbi:MAG: NADH:flavin oxidoreductase [Lachnospiraceae bacterium]|nr:NADH:flavin oxidoreductase [Lachnospiraceae bacterium]